MSHSLLPAKLSNLRGVKETKPNQWQALCPAHDDHNPSLTVTQIKDGKILLFCHAGCNLNDIIKALGLTLDDLDPNKGTSSGVSGPCSVVATYDYMDEHGHLLYQCVRAHPKRFWYRQPDEKGSWINDLKGVSLVLYRLPELLNADVDTIVYICEGEKDVDRLTSLELVATTNPHGAGKWRKEYSEYLRNRRVVILPDNDRPGAKHAQKVAASLQDIAQEIKIVDLPDLSEKGDISDWLDGGGTVEALQEIVKSTVVHVSGSLDETKAAGDAKEVNTRPPSAASVLAKLADKATLFHDSEMRSYATYKVNDHFETWSTRSPTFKNWLLRQYYPQTSKVPNSRAIADALSLIDAKATYDGIEQSVFLRLAEHEGVVYLDLCNPSWEVVKVTAGGWSITSSCPIRFVRSKAMLAIDRPQAGGSLPRIRRFFNVSDDGWILIIAWLIGTLSPNGPYPVLVLQGEQGTAKSSTARMLRSLVDSASAPLRAAPRNEHDLMIAARNSWILAFDNLSGLPYWLSDSLCRLSTGGGLGTRELYSDSEEMIFNAKRPVILNMIEDITTRADLHDRSLLVSLDPISPAKRIDERTLWQQFDCEIPSVLGCLLDAVNSALR